MVVSSLPPKRPAAIGRGGGSRIILLADTAATGNPHVARDSYTRRVPTPVTRAWDSIRVGMDLLTCGLLVLVLWRGLSAEPGVRWSILIAAAVTAAVYLTGLLPAVRDHRDRALIWLVAFVVAWSWLLWLVPDGVYLAFPLYFFAAHLLPDRAGVVAVAGLAALGVVGYAAHRGLDAAAVIGPVLGALVAIATVLGLRAVQGESERRGVLEERERLAREIHDTLAQGLSSINLLLGAAASRLPDDPDNRSSADLIAEAREVATTNLAEARRFVHALRPPALDDAPLTQALGKAVAEVPGATLQISGEAQALPPAHEVALLRIAREALTNARNHAEAAHIALTLSYLDDAVALDVVDDGIGFDAAAPTHGFGLTSMTARAADLGGRLEIESTHGEGTALAVLLPVGHQP